MLGVICSRARFLHLLPGRLRVEVYGLKYNRQISDLIKRSFSAIDGILLVKPCSDTGRVLIQFDERRISSRQIIDFIITLERTSLKTYTIYNNAHEIKPENIPPVIPVKSCADVPSINNNEINFPEICRLGHAAGAETKSQMFKERSLTKQAQAEVAASSQALSLNHSARFALPNVSVPMALSAGGFGVLTLKQILTGRSAMARSPAAFNAAALVSVVSGYPQVKRTAQAILPQGKLDFLLGASALGLALVRENIVVLAGLTILQLVKWKKSQLPENYSEAKPAQIREIRSYSEKAGKRNLLLAGAAWALTRDPLIGLAVLLAGNPRVTTAPAEYAWSQADYAATSGNLFIPENTSLEQLAKVDTVILADTSVIMNNDDLKVQSIVDQDKEVDLWASAASLMKKTNHPWKDEVLEQAHKFRKTIRSAFKVEEFEQGVSASVNGSEVLIGTIRFLQQHGVDCDHNLIEVKREERHGFEVLCLAKNKEYLGSIKKKPQIGVNPEYNELVTKLRERNIKICVLENSQNLNEDDLSQYGIDQSLTTVPKEEITEKLAAWHNSGTEFLFIAGHKDPFTGRILSHYILMEQGYPVVSIDDLNRLNKSIDYARKIDQVVKQNFAVGKFWNMIGMALGVTGYLSAPVINLIGDAVTLALLARSKRTSEERLILGNKGTKVTPLSKVNSSPELATLPTDRTQPQPRRPSEKAWHSIAEADVLKIFGVNEQTGLLADQLKEAKSKFGLNQLEQKKPVPWIVSYLGQFKEFTTLVVLGTSLLAFVSGDIFDGLAMGSILLINAGIGAVQERKAEKVIDALNEYQPPKCKVLRGANHLEMNGNELVPGDIVSFEAGDRVPADLRLIRTWNLEANEAALTGESLPVAKTTLVLKADCPLAERKNMLYMGTDITRGKGIGIVVRTGMDTEIGYLMSLMKGQEKVVTPLHERVTKISKTFVKGAAIAAGTVFLVGLLRGRGVREMITTSITLAASAVPEGLPVTITIALSAGIFRMAKRNALIRKLSALETLGRTTVICTDKTGTLTKNEMTVKRVATMDKVWTVTGDGYNPQGQLMEIQSKLGIDQAAPATESELATDTEENSELTILSRSALLI
ncbi:MAG: HAD-IC family P-type ATPase, partial [Desulfitobacterium hafniense]|nr:HAD-IC family P-type ATPase [Desulfitobacterium hafniense]